MVFEVIIREELDRWNWEEYRTSTLETWEVWFLKFSKVLLPDVGGLMAPTIPMIITRREKNEFDQVDSGVRSLTSYAVGCWQQLFTEEPDSWRGTPLTHWCKQEWGKNKNSRLESSVIVRFHSGTGDKPAEGRKTQPESNPPLTGVHGSLNVDWVTEWFPGLWTQ